MAKKCPRGRRADGSCKRKPGRKKGSSGGRRKARKGGKKGRCVRCC